MTTDDLYVERGGEGSARGGHVLLLLHGMGGTGAVWRGLVELLPGHRVGSWVVPDLPGHGGSAPLGRYSFGALAAAVARLVPGDRAVRVVGHSLGGAVGLTLASGWFGVRVTSVVGVGIKVRWTPEELAGASALAAKPVRVLPTREEAADRAARIAGLAGLVGPGSPALDRLVVGADGGWRPAFDPRAMAVGEPHMTGLLSLAAARGVRVVLAAGELDPMSPQEHLRALVPDPVVLPGLGHSAHVEDPKSLLGLI